MQCISSTHCMRIGQGQATCSACSATSLANRLQDCPWISPLIVPCCAGEMEAPNSHGAKASSSPKHSTAFKSSSAVATVIINVCHCLTFAPLLLFITLQDV